MKKAISLLAAVTLALGIFMPLNAQSDKAVTLPKQVINGDAENSTYGWTAMNGTVENVKLDDGNRVIKLTPTDQYGTPQFDIGPAIINDDSMKDSADYYAGGGAGKYTVSFRFKPGKELTADKYFSPKVCSAVYNLINIDVTTDCKPANFAIMKLGSNWTNVTATFTVTDADLEKLTAYYNGGTADAADAYLMYLRLDGSGNGAFNGGNDLFNYYIDDFTITKVGAVTPTEPKAIETVNGDAELGTTENWSVAGGNGSVENIAIDDNHVIKFTPTTIYGFPEFDIRPSVLQTAPTDSAYYAGGGAGLYSVKFKIKAVNPEDIGENGEEFGLSLATGSWSDKKSVGNIKLTKENAEQWTEVDKTFYLDETMFSSLNAGNLLSIRINGWDKAFSDGTFAYYLDDFAVEKIKFNSFSVDIANDFTFNYKVKNFPEGASVTFEIDGKQIGETLNSGTVDENGATVFSLKNITPLWASKKVVATLTVNGEVKDEKSYSLEDYCVETLNTTDDAKLRRLLADLLCYCRATQNYAGETENLTDSEAWIKRGFATLNDVDYEKPTDKAVTSDCNNKTASWKSAALVLKNNVAVRFRFTAQNAENLKAVVTVNGKGTTVTDIKSDGTAYYFDFDNLYVSQFLDTMTVRIYSGDTQISNTLTYSVYSYALSKHNDSNGNLGKLVDSIMNYGLSAQAYIK